jgi:peptidyl-prolyl cis-trans isomerase SurA
MRRALAALTTILALAGTGAAMTGPAAAQRSLFAAAARVNGEAITNYQVDQRALFLDLLRAPGADRETARETLIDEALQVQAARRAGIEISDEEIEAGLAEFAGRANLSTEEFVAALERAGVATETFRDFVRNGLFWRNLVRERFGPRAQPSRDEIERALARDGDGGGVRVLISEIALPITPGTQGEVEALAQRLSDGLAGEAAFAEAARTYSRAASAARGGRVDWLPLAGLPPEVSAEVLALSPGEVSEPVDLGAFVGLFLLRALDEEAPAAAVPASVDVAQLRIPGGRSPAALAAAADLRARIDTCGDLYGEAPSGAVTRDVRRTAELPADIRQELAKLDANEVSTLLTRGADLLFLMRCEPVIDAPEDAFEATGQQILNRRLEDYADGYLEELRADAIVE